MTVRASSVPRVVAIRSSGPDQSIAVAGQSRVTAHRRRGVRPMRRSLEHRPVLAVSRKRALSKVETRSGSAPCSGVGAVEQAGKGRRAVDRIGCGDVAAGGAGAWMAS